MAFLLQDDNEQAFQAALSFLDSFEPATGSSSQEKQADVSSQQPARANKRRGLSNTDKARRRAEINERKRWLRKTGVYGDPNRARNAQVKEISYLREQFEKLQVDLQGLQEKRAQKEANARVLVLQIPSLWQKLADRQLQCREEAERTNIRLKLAVDHHRKAIDSLSGLLQKRASQLASDCSSFAELRSVKNHVVQELDFSRDSSELRTLLLHIDEAYRDIDCIFETIGLNSMDTAPGDVHIRERISGKYQYLEFFSNNILPFDLKATKEATWSYFKGVEKHLGYGNLYNKAAKDLDEPYTVLEDLTKELYSENARADIRIKQVVRRYVEDDRDAVIRVYRAVPVEISTSSWVD